MKRARAFGIVVTLAVFVAAGCAINKPPETPEITASAAPNAKVAEAWRAAAATGPVAEPWLTALGDPQLVALVEEALRYNNDLAVTSARLEQAAGYVKMVGGSLYPTVDAAARGSIGDDSSGMNFVGVQASWEIDLWGRVRYGKAAAEADYASAVADLAGARQSLAAMVAKAWFLASEARLQRLAAKGAFDAATEQLGLSLKRLDVGIGNEQETALTRADAAKYEAAVLELELAEASARRALEVMLGRYPSAELEAVSPLRAPETPVPAGIPAELLERRPDIIAARTRAAAAFYRVGEADKARLPRLSLTASVGAVDSQFLQFVPDFENPIIGLGANLLAPIFRGGALKAQVEIRTAEQKEAVARYGGVVLRAFQEVEDSMAADANLARREQVLSGMLKDSARSVELSQIQFDVGRVAMLSVVQERMRLYAAESSLIRVQAERLVQRVNLYLALAGDFLPAPIPEVAVPAPVPTPAPTPSAP
jgi:NodT family efflux transporter outer membrane factor (OMF) lipoprotein